MLFDLVFLFSHSFTNAILHCSKPGFHPVASVRNDSDVRVGVVVASLLRIYYIASLQCIFHFKRVVFFVLECHKF